jgi:TetR/AcrR family transcriptional repressor of nem operon
MPWPKDHKSRTHERIVQAAAAAFRARGVSGVRVEDIMAEAGLTHGGFYAHFASKHDLLGEALEHASGQTVQTLSRPLASVPAERMLLAVADAYLSPEHAAHPDRGCPVSALGSEGARVGGRTQRALARSVQQRLDWMRSLVPRSSTRRRDNQLIGALACMVGGVILARAVDRHDSEAILAACRQFLHDALADTRSSTRHPSRSTRGTRPRTRGSTKKDPQKRRAPA